MKFFECLAKNKSLYILGALCILIIVAMGYVKGEYDILDAKFFYLKSEIQPLLISLGEEGRATYMKVNYIDFTFMTVYTLFFFGMYSAFFKNLAKTLVVIPSLLFFADLIETSIIHYLLRSFPEIHTGLEYTLMFLTPTKWMLALSTLLVIVNGYFVNLYMKKT